MKQQRVEAFIFDLFGVLISFDEDMVYSRLARHCANPAEAFENLNGVMSARDVITGKRTLRQIHQQLASAHGLTLDFAGFESAWLEPYSAPMPGMAELVRNLSSNYKLVLLSNVDGFYWEVVRAAHPELACFDSLLVSCELGLAKPDPQIFRRASEAAGADASRCFFIDDTRMNVDAARSLGFQAHWFRGLPGLARELKKAGTKGFSERDPRR